MLQLFRSRANLVRSNKQKRNKSHTHTTYLHVRAEPTNITYLFTVFADVIIDFVESAEHVELCGVESGLFCQIGIHVLVTNGWEPVDVSIVPGDTDEGRRQRLAESM